MMKRVKICKYVLKNIYYFVDPPEGVEVEGAGQKLVAGEETTFTCTARNASGLLAFREHTIDKMR
jgi:hypothetical protein